MRRAHTASDVFVTEPRPLPKAAVRGAGQSTFPMRLTKHLRFQCSRRLPPLEPRAVVRRLSTRRGSKVETKGKRVSPRDLSPCFHLPLCDGLDHIPRVTSEIYDHTMSTASATVASQNTPSLSIKPHYQATQKEGSLLISVTPYHEQQLLVRGAIGRAYTA